MLRLTIQDKYNDPVVKNPWVPILRPTFVSRVAQYDLLFDVDIMIHLLQNKSKETEDLVLLFL